MDKRYIHNDRTPGRTPPQTAAMPYSLYRSLKGQYFMGYADNMYFEMDKSAWAMLYNPQDSGVNLFVNVWTMTDLYEPPTRVQIWFNSRMPGDAMESPLLTTVNFTMQPQPKPKAKLVQASNVTGEPDGGAKAYARRSLPGETIVKEEEGKIILPPGGNITVFISNSEGVNIPAYTRVAYGWWEEPR